MFQNIIRRVTDNSYVITKNGLPYHVPNEGEFADEWARVHAYALAHPDEVTEEEPPPPPEPPSPEELSAQFTAAINARLNEFARAKDYDNMDKARLAAMGGSFQADGLIAQQAYDTTWTAAIAIWEQVTSGALTVDQVLEQLPALTWPGEGE
ncbi:MAG: hypothetical protein LBJ14_06635 [Desulfarculales bacterium]|jgi:hypothetical protein|nr:hypothetical protein [Desulfarculales bacterium]